MGVKHGTDRGARGLVLCVLLLAFCSCRNSGTSGDVRIDLRRYPVFLKSGFEKSLAGESADETWKRIDPAPGNPAAIKIKYSGLEGLPGRRFLSPRRGRDQEFTIKIPFTADDRFMETLQGEKPFTPGIFLAGIGDNWEVFLNGTLVKSEVHLDSDGQILSHRSYHHVRFPARRSLFVPGTNILTIRIVGDPAYENTGLFVAAPYYIGNAEIMEAENSEAATMILCGVYVFLGIYHLFLFLLRRNARHNLYYCLFSTSLGIYFLIRSAAVFSLVPDTNILLRFDMGTLFMVIPLLSAFAEELNFKKLLPQTKCCLAFFAFLALLQACFSLSFGEDILKIWQALAIGAALYVAGYNFIFVFFSGAYRKWRKEGGRLLAVLGKMLFSTILGNLMIGILILLATGLFDIFDAMILHRNLFSSRYGFFVFTIGAAFVLAREFGSLYKALNQANVALEASNTNLEVMVQERTRELEVQTAIAKQASRAKSEFLARMSHEIRTPLNVVIGLADVELRNVAEGETGRNLKEIRNSGAVLLTIINDLLDISKIESGRLDLSPAEYKLADMLRDSIRMNLFRIASKPVRFKADIDPALPERLYGDEIRIKQILNNLLSNAGKYTDAGTITLRVRGKTEGSDIVLIFSVEDTGRGIKEDNLEQLFSEYRRFDEEMDRDIEGAGLGLSITKKLAELMGGAITVQSVYHQGSVFTVTIRQMIISSVPMGGVDTFDSSVKDNGEPPLIVYFQKPDAQILVVDDMTTNLRVAQALLRPYEFKVSCVTSGKQAVEIIREEHIKFDLIFMDHMMPGMDGIETVRIIRNELTGYAQTVPIIALTANAIVGNEKMFLENGFQGFLSKPIDLVKLDHILRIWIGAS